MSDQVVLPVEANLPTPEHDPDKEAAMRAAMFYDRAKQERDEMLRLLEQSKMALQVRDHQIASLELQVATERNRYDALQASYNEAVQDKADLEAILSTQQAHHEDQASRLARFEFSRLKRKRNGKRNGDAMSDASGSTVEVDIASVLASGTAGPVLGPQSEGR